MRDGRFDASLSELSRRLRAQELSPVDVVRSTLARIEARNVTLSAFACVSAERAIEAAERAEAELARGEWRGPLHGIPFTVKDLFDARGTPTTAGSRFLVDSAPSATDSTVVERLEAAGAILVGKANLHEFAYGTTSDSSVFGPVRNPWNPERIAGGSSGGSAAAVAAGLGLFSLGTDTGGSIRIPAALCGVVGLKPTFGRVSRAGLLPLAPGLDHVGPLARTAEDAAHVMGVIAGADPRDAAAVDRPVPDFAAALIGHLEGVRIGAIAPKPDEADDTVAGAFEAALAVLESAGARVSRIEVPTQAETRQAAYVVLFAEAAATHAVRMERDAARFFPDVRERFERGAMLSAVEYLQALATRERVRAELGALWSRFDVLASPMVPIAAVPLGTGAVRLAGEERMIAAVTTTHTREWNLLGNPALSLPTGFDVEGMPVALQLVGRQWEEATILRAADAYQQRTDWHTERPEVHPAAD